MATKIISMTYQLKRGAEAAIEAANPILASGEPIIVFCPNNVTKIKVGDGSTPYRLLPFVGGTVSYDGDGDIVNVVVDSELSLTSTNPVQNKIITKALNDKANKSDLENKVDKLDGMGLSTNDYSDEEKDKLATVEAGATKTIVDTEFDSESQNPIQNSAVAQAFANLHSLLSYDEELNSITIDGGEIVADD